VGRVSERPTRARLGVLALLFGCVVIAYMDRANVSVAGTAISASLALSPVQLGYIFSAFGWAYAALQIPGGMLTNFVRPRFLYPLALIVWSGATMLQGLAGGFVSLFGLRLATGAGEAPAYPINNRVVTSWFPDHERASAIAVYTSGQYLGLAPLTPAMAVMLHWIGWRGLFVATGLVGVMWSGIWFSLYRDPRTHTRVNEAELEVIGGSSSRGFPRTSSSTVGLRS
jgi:ACS family D-galactonate transporter-like MFS transporter